MVYIDCPFCNPSEEDIVLKNELCYARFDKYPVNKGHMLIIPFRHFDNYFDTIKEEKLAILELIDKTKEFLDREYKPDGYNIGVNVGKPAGQTIMHVHIHIIPRYKGDIEDPTGGVRGIIPERRIYR
ncbi:Diadenosine tetraphosphate (Ap4A) hydrolase [Persephonella hydrogeniphila]|uniref:Diadenosine tetraphosphate (Ap4A) hydrolase n=1 Tax=Persephonella hydrogeniphila TaxID=198703 RepID=A0A285NBQ3_9AQUI|nr:HIT family protein [Persephonella hydrogeniphila]SNZ06912.1 Diadenosine tetraphosphate (Ap4A) hydrolase [Persephonella hydrogeniphila]